MNTSRVEAFSDGVFSIAITLLIFGIAVPTLTEEAVSHGALAPAVYVLALLLSLLSIKLTLAIYILVPLSYVIPSPIDQLANVQNQHIA